MAWLKFELSYKDIKVHFFSHNTFPPTLWSICTGCLKMDSTHSYDNDLLLKQTQWQSFWTRLVKKCNLLLETSDQYFVLNVILSASRTCNFLIVFFCLSNKSLLYWWVAFILRQTWITGNAKYFTSLGQIFLI